MTAAVRRKSNERHTKYYRKTEILYSVISVLNAVCLNWKEVFVRHVASCMWLNNKTTGLMLLHRYDLVHKPILASFSHLMLQQPMISENKVLIQSLHPQHPCA
jgi:hypothetical protein